MIPKDTDLTYKIAVALTPGISAEVVRLFESRGVALHEFFELSSMALQSRMGINIPGLFPDCERQEALVKAREEQVFVERHHISTYFLLDDDYPPVLQELPDAPVMLFILGKPVFDASPSIAMVGTRRCTSYGTSFCEKFISDLAVYYPEALIVSGLAYGIDAASHAAALRNGLPTAAVLAHGLDIIYPSPHRELARQIIASGGALITEYPSRTRPFRGNFLKRNRIVAGLSELTFVVESEVKGGAMSTAHLAFTYDREVYALPGRYTDSTSSGTNMLISRGKAHIFTSLADLMSNMGWPLKALNNARPPEKNLFPELEGDAARIYQLLKTRKAPVAIDEIHSATGIAMPLLISTLTELEFDGVVAKLPGARYEAQ